MSNVESINKPKVDPLLVEQLEELLHLAKEGSLNGIIYVDRYHNGDVGFGYSGSPCIGMVGEMEVVKQFVIDGIAFGYEE